MVQQKFVCMGAGVFLAGMLSAVTRTFPRQAAMVSRDNGLRAKFSLNLLTICLNASVALQACVVGGFSDSDRLLECFAFIDIIKYAGAHHVLTISENCMRDAEEYKQDMENAELN